jgi:uncharacterized membrane protein YiaA
MIVSIVAAVIVTVQFAATIMVVLWVQRLAHTMMIGRYRSQGQLLVMLVAVGLLTIAVMSRFTDGLFKLAEQIR